jgi:O-antigen/teichoic acid export membrane protein
MSELFARNTAYGMVAGIVSSFGRLAATVVVARVLGVHDNGIFNFMLWIVGIVAGSVA